MPVVQIFATLNFNNLLNVNCVVLTMSVINSFNNIIFYILYKILVKSLFYYRDVLTILDFLDFFRMNVS